MREKERKIERERHIEGQRERKEEKGEVRAMENEKRGRVTER